MPEQQKMAGPPKQQSTWEKIPFFVKLILALCVIGILYFLIWGTSMDNILEFMVRAFILAILTFLAYFLVKRFMSFFEPKPFSPKENLHSRLVNMATIAVPPNIDGHKLITVGSKAFRGTEYGRVTGMLKLPLFVGQTHLDEEGKIVYRKDERGNPTNEPERDLIKTNESEYFFVVKRGRFLPKFVFVRCHEKYVLSLDGDVMLRTSNLVPIMSSNYSYPYEQIFEDSSRVMLQNMNEIVITTFDHQHDLIANTTEHALSFNPYWEYSRRLSQETMTSPEK